MGRGREMVMVQTFPGSQTCLVLTIYIYISIFMPLFEEEGVYCFANVGLSVGMLVGR